MQKKILEDNKLEPAIRVALRNIKDFAVPLVIENSLFWKFHSINEQEAKSMLPRIEVKRQIIEKKEIKELKKEHPKQHAPKKAAIQKEAEWHPSAPKSL